MDIGLATSTPPVDHDPGAGVYSGRGFRGLGFTIRIPVIFNLLFSSMKGRAGGAGKAAAERSATVWVAIAAAAGSTGVVFKNCLRFIDGPRFRISGPAYSLKQGLRIDGLGDDGHTIALLG